MSSSWIPAGMSLVLDTHVLPKAETSEKKECTGGEIAQSTIEQDVGLYTGQCPVCKQSFVWMRGENTWVLEQDFERQVQLVNERMSTGSSAVDLD